LRWFLQYDGACDSAGFLCEAFDYLQRQPNLTTSDQKTLQTRTFYGKEKKSLAYVIAIMNMILHGIEAPNAKMTSKVTVTCALASMVDARWQGFGRDLRRPLHADDGAPANHLFNGQRTSGIPKIQRHRKSARW
jgi:N-6 DNA Methylase